MILSDNAILTAIAHGEIGITPFDRACLGPNSYDVHLAPYLTTYCLPPARSPFEEDARRTVQPRLVLDCRQPPHVFEDEIPEAGYVLEPGRLYLASTVEQTWTTRVVPYLDGKSSVGRLGIFTHVTAGRGDVGFVGHWTMEIVVVHAVRVYAGMPIGQITFHAVAGQILQSYDDQRHAGKYLDAAMSPRPQPSRMYLNFQSKPTPPEERQLPLSLK